MWMQSNKNQNAIKKMAEDAERRVSEFLKIRDIIKPKKEALKIILIYAVIGSLWILFSDDILHSLPLEENLHILISKVKGWFYVGVTSGIFYFIIKGKMDLFKNANEKMLSAYDELNKAHNAVLELDSKIGEQYRELEDNRNALYISEQRYKLAIDGADDGIWDWDLVTDKYFTSMKWKDTPGETREEYFTSEAEWIGRFHPEEYEHNMKVMRDYLQSGEGAYMNRYRLRTDKGNYRWVLSKGKAIWDENGKAVRIAGSHADVTEFIELENEVLAEKELFESMFSFAPNIVGILNHEGKMIRCNPFTEEVSGYTEQELIGKNVIDMFFPEKDKAQLADIVAKVLSGGHIDAFETEVIHRDGYRRTIFWNGTMMTDRTTGLPNMLFVGTDVTGEVEMQRRLDEISFYDPLTKLPNQILFQREFTQLLEDRQKENISAPALVYVDIDNFKHFNETMGHSIGDTLLIRMAEILSIYITAPSLIARFSGDQFCLMIVDMTTEEIVARLEQMREYVKKPFEVNGYYIYMAFSAGIAVCPKIGCDYQLISRNADSALYNAKANGRNRIEIYSPSMEEISKQFIRISGQIRSALNNDQFLLHYQPQFCVQTQKLHGMEALIRIADPAGGLISPKDFIPFAERNGFIIPIEEWVLQTALKQRREWNERGCQCKICVNLSEKSLVREDIADFIVDIAGKLQLDTREIEIEITETAVMSDFDKAVATLKRLRSLGCSVALDDFGTGSSSLTYLNTLPIDTLKIDREFIKDIQNEDDDMPIYRFIIDLAHEMGMKVITEGVETEAQLAFIKKHGCDIAQGYLLGYPMPAEMTAFTFKA